ncbi:MAG: S8 family serine peptidase [Phycisphaerae bacterium]
MVLKTQGMICLAFGWVAVSWIGAASVAMAASEAVAPASAAGTPPSIAGTPAAGAGAPGTGGSAPDGYASDRIIVRFTPEAMGVNNGVPLLQGVGNQLQPAVSAAVHDACRAWGVTTMRRCVSDAFAHPELARQVGLDRTFVLDVPPGTDVTAMAADFRGFAGEVESAGVDGIGSVAGFLPDDTDFGAQWGMHNTGQPAQFPPAGTPGADIDAPAAWAIHTGGEGTVTIAIVDSGVSMHNDYAAHVIGGFNIPAGTSTHLSDADSCLHGTHVTGIAAAIGNNGQGVAGVTWGANILRVKVLATCSGFVSDTTAGIIWAVDHGADIINMSLQFYNLSQDSIQAFQAAADYAESNGVLIVAAAGNDRGFVVAYPAVLPNVMAVSATNNRDELAVVSNFGCQVDVAAPGEGIWSTWGSSPNAYYWLTGTSMATPHVTGLAALLKSYLPGATPAQLWQMIEDTADTMGNPCDQCDEVDLCGPGNSCGPGQGCNPNRNYRFGSGRINAGSALAAAATSPRIVSSDPPDGAIDARQPHDIDGANPVGWDQVTLTFDNDVATLAPSDFSLVDSDGMPGPTVLAVVTQTQNSATLMLDGPIAVGKWTTIRHTITDTSIRLGYLPGDVNGDGVSTPGDILAVIDGLNGITILDLWQADADRSGVAGPEDILRVIDLLNGAAAFDAYLDASLP